MEEITPLRKLQLVELDIVKEIVRICEENDITYYISGGTYLGAVRHKGFIPWDDDADIAMPREDYERFLEIAPRQANPRFELVTYKNDKDYLHYPAKLTCSDKKVINKSTIDQKIENAWVDIFPLDGMPSNFLANRIHRFNLLFKRLMLQYAAFDKIVKMNKKDRPLHERILIGIRKYIKIGKNADPKKKLDKIDKALKKCPAATSKYYVNFMGSYKFKSIISKEVYAEGAQYEFEGLKLNGPKYYDTYLTQIYGDYMKLPPIDKQNVHGSEVIED